MRPLTEKEMEKILADQLFQLPYFRAMLRGVEESFYLRTELAEPILDVGAGDGQFAQVVFKGRQIVGIDPWWKPLTEASERRVYPLLSQAKGDKLPFKENSFPTAVSNSVLEHIPDVQPVLNEIARKLKPGGQFIFTVPNQRFKTELWSQALFNSLHLKVLAEKYSVFFNKIARHYNLDQPEIWTERLKDAGFEKVAHFNYFPRWALHKLERGHLWGLPNLLWKKLFGRWILFPSRRNPFIPYQMARRLLADAVCEDGTCSFFIAVKGLDEA